MWPGSAAVAWSWLRVGTYNPSFHGPQSASDSQNGFSDQGWYSTDQDHTLKKKTGLYKYSKEKPDPDQTKKFLSIVIVKKVNYFKCYTIFYNFGRYILINKLIEKKMDSIRSDEPDPDFAPDLHGIAAPLCCGNWKSGRKVSPQHSVTTVPTSLEPNLLESAREAAKKVLFWVAWPLKGRGRGKGRTT